MCVCAMYIHVAAQRVREDVSLVQQDPGTRVLCVGGGQGVEEVVDA